MRLCQRLNTRLLLRFCPALFLLLVFSPGSQAQGGLPAFNVSTRGKNRILVNWMNRYPVTRQISIQRSFDSTRNFKTILTVPDPSAVQNGFVDTKAPTQFMFYRLFILLDSGKYVFTPSKRPFWDTARKLVVKPAPSKKEESVSSRTPAKKEAARKETEKAPPKNQPPPPPPPPKPKPEKIYLVKKKDSLIRRVPERAFKAFRDSLVYKTKDTLVFASLDTLLIKPFVPKPVFKPSIYVYTAKDGNINIALPNALHNDYRIKFFEENNSPIFELKEIRESALILDKVNFLHSGWFRFELYENGKLVEKNKFYIPKDF